MKIQRAAMAMIIVFLTFYLLYLGQTLLLPLVIAGAIAYLISILAHAIAKLAYKGFSVPKPLAMFFADRDHTLVAFLSSSAHHGQHSERDQGRPLNISKTLKLSFFKAYSFFREGEVPNIREFLNQLDFGAYLQSFGATVRAPC
jgi:hypothetical protein